MAGGFQSSIVTRNYKSGSIIYFENDKSEYIYILKSGRVVLTYIKIDSGEEIKEEVRQGEFFGVKSALGKYPREETAQTIGDTTILVLAMADFERMVLRNVNVVKKMLRVFSNQLRKLNKTVRTVLGEGDNIHPDVELFRIGEYYYKSGDYNKATYAFKRYMEYYPDTDYSKLAMDRIKDISVGGGGVSSDKQPKASADNILSDFSMDNDSGGFSFDDNLTSGKDTKSDFNLDSSFGGNVSSASSLSSELSSEMDNFFSESDKSDDFGGFDFDHKPAGKNTFPIEEKFNEGLNSFKASNYKKALPKFSEIISKAPFDDPGDNGMLIDSYFYSGVCNFNLKNFKEAMNSFGEIVKKYSKSNRMKETLMYAGEIYEKSGQKDKAIEYFNKVVNFSPKDSLNSKALDKIKALQKK
ncbi:MAG: cyclic nucleotide-binding domain-containing protein, partial [Leptospirales bacterium]|nr:cyclic nucleotide-binding domain-containing protein [Leptospirales bacterium]